MKLSRKIAIVSPFIAGAFVALWFHEQKAAEWNAASATRSSAEQGDAKAEFKLGLRYYYGSGVPRDYAEAIRWYRKAADQGYAKAQFNLGDMYFRGVGTSQDYGEATHWIQKAADQGNSKAQAGIGYMYYNGIALPKDYSQAIRWYRKAADQGDPSAQQSLGYMYANGQGTSQDDTEAIAWYRKAADQGDIEAQQSLGYMYANGRGVPRDYGEASRWYAKAASHGNVKATRALKLLRIRSRPPTQTRYIEISMAFLGFPVGVWLVSDFLLPGRKFRGWRQSALMLLGVTFLLNAGLSLYAFAHDIRYSPHHDAFHLARKVLVGTAILIVVTLVLPTKKEPNV